MAIFCLFFCSGHEAIARILIEHGANVEARGDDSWTPLFHAARKGKVQMFYYMKCNAAAWYIHAMKVENFLKGKILNESGEFFKKNKFK